VTLGRSHLVLARHASPKVLQSLWVRQRLKRFLLRNLRELESGKYQPLPEVPGKGKAKVTEEQAGPDLDAQAEDQTGSDAGAQAEGQARSNPDETSKGQAGPDPGDVEAKVQSILSP
nr:hypothetical protein [Tanacetum cinerariifolium]